ncbi:MAG: peptidoglycan DD-metalloendopeptidase family protein [Chloroflexota bacterium]|nr:peptidoglycan DD-metalloendopeptidase family protein [Chloroflexota bacterium]
MRARPGHRVSRVLLALLLAMPVILSGTAVLPSSPVRADDLTDRIASSRERQQELLRSIERNRETLVQLRADEDLADVALAASGSHLDEINTDQDAVRQEIGAATDALSRVQARHDSLVSELSQLDWTVDLLESEIAQGEQDLDARKRVLGERLAEAYRTGQTSLLEQLLDGGSFADVVTDIDAHLRFGDLDVELAREIEADQDQLDSLRRLTVATRYSTDQLRLETMAAQDGLLAEQQRLEDARARLTLLEEETQARQQAQRDEFQRIVGDQGDTQAFIAEHQAAEDRLDEQIADLVAEAQRRAEEEARRLAELEAQRIAEEAARLEAQQAARAAQEAARAAQEQRERERRDAPAAAPAPAPRGTGLMAWPVSGHVTQEYGCSSFPWYAPRGGCASFHDGIDISNADGTPIRAAGAGVVAFVGYNPYEARKEAAWIVAIGHANGLDSRYAHLQPRYAPGVRAGSRVTRGQVIGYMGSTGNSTGTHLHWQVNRNGVAVDPRSQL